MGTKNSHVLFIQLFQMLTLCITSVHWSKPGNKQCGYSDTNRSIKCIPISPSVLTNVLFFNQKSNPGSQVFPCLLNLPQPGSGPSVLLCLSRPWHFCTALLIPNGSPWSLAWPGLHNTLSCHDVVLTCSVSIITALHCQLTLHDG